jgi:ketosteroid isomerase-like protein
VREWADPEEVVRRGYEAFRSRGLRGWARMCDPEVEFDMTTTGIAGLGIYRGREEVVAFLEEWSSAFEPFDLTLEEVRRLDRASALAVYSQRGRPTVGGPPETLRYAQIVEVADGRIVRARTYADLDQARHAAELQRDPAIAGSEGL